MTRVRVSVVKIGGSLLRSSNLATRLREWLAVESAAEPDSHFVFIVGGGMLADAIREIDARANLPAETCHWACVELMDVTARLVSAMLPEVATVNRFLALERRLTKRGATILQPSEFLKHEEPTLPGTRLNCDWSVTSDSIAGRLAVVVHAAELVLLKSTEPPLVQRATNDLNWVERLADTGFVDAFLPQLAAEIASVRCIDFCAGQDRKLLYGSNLREDMGLWNAGKT